MLPPVTDGLVLSLLSSDPKWSDTAETIPATVGGAIASWAGEGFRATQGNATHGPVLQANGIQFGPNPKWFVLDSPIVLPSDFTFYATVMVSYSYRRQPLLADIVGPSLIVLNNTGDLRIDSDTQQHVGPNRGPATGNVLVKYTRENGVLTIRQTGIADNVGALSGAIELHHVGAHINCGQYSAPRERMLSLLCWDRMLDASERASVEAFLATVDGVAY